MAKIENIDKILIDIKIILNRHTRLLEEILEELRSKDNELTKT